jgi:hypothetical protein
MKTTIKMLLAGVAALSIASIPVSAKDLVPTQFRGNWCGLADDPEYVRTPKPCRPDEDMTSMTVTADKVYYHADDGTTYGRCNVLMTDRYRPGKPEYIARLKCGDAPTELYWMYLSGGKLFHDKFRGGGYR